MPKRNVSNVSGDGGNTKPSPNRARRERCRNFAFTLNNYTDEEIEALKKMSQCLIVFGKEICPKTGTPHLQGYVEFKNQKDFSALKKFNERIHWEAAIAKRECNLRYCGKDENIIFNTFEKVINPIKFKKQQILEKQYSNIEWKNWQKQIIEIVESAKNSRTIYWYWENTGNIGKSFLCKYLWAKYSCVLGDGKKNDVAYSIAKWQEQHEMDDPDLVLIDVPRTNLDYVNYSMLEKLKDGLFSSGKYESTTVAFAESPHIIVFANAPPVTYNCSADRWVIVEINEAS